MSDNNNQDYTYVQPFMVDYKPAHWPRDDNGDPIDANGITIPMHIRKELIRIGTEWAELAYSAHIPQTQIAKAVGRSESWLRGMATIHNWTRHKKGSKIAEAKKHKAEKQQLELFAMPPDVPAKFPGTGKNEVHGLFRESAHNYPKVKIEKDSPPVKKLLREVAESSDVIITSLNEAIAMHRAAIIYLDNKIAGYEKDIAKAKKRARQVAKLKKPGDKPAKVHNDETGIFIESTVSTETSIGTRAGKEENLTATRRDKQLLRWEDCIAKCMEARRLESRGLAQANATLSRHIESKKDELGVQGGTDVVALLFQSAGAPVDEAPVDGEIGK